MYIVVALLFLSFSPQQQQQELCADRAACRAMAEAAREANDDEAFHDLAWAAYRKGKNNDPELMLLVARAQSLSGRPGDALVMLERIAALGAPTDAATSEDFARVRALPRWSEVAEKLASPTKADVASPPPDPKTEPKPVTKEPATDTPPTRTPEKSAAKPVEKTLREKTEKAAGKNAKPAEKPTEKPAEEPKKPSAEKPAEKAAAPTEKATAPKKDPNAPLVFTTLLSPGALAFDVVSQRFLIADRKARRVAVVDANTGQVATMIGALGSPGEIVGMAIDAQQGDLWIASIGEDGPVLHKVQLISGRILTSVPLDIEETLTAITYAHGTGLIAADVNGVVWAVKGDGTMGKLAELEYVPRALAADAKGRLYVSGGTARFARFSIGSTLRKIDTISIDETIPTDAPFVAVGAARLTFIVPAEGSFEIRNVPVK